MRIILLATAALAACAAPDEGQIGNGGEAPFDYATILSAAPSDPGPILEIERARTGYEMDVEAARSPFPGNQSDAQAELDRWIERLQPRGLLGGGGTGRADGSISLDLAMTRADWTALVAEEGWNVPAYLRISFVAPMGLPAASDAALKQVRIMPVEPHRTVFQLEALGTGRIFLEDGCLKVGEPGTAKLAFFHAETGIDVRDGELVLVDRISGAWRGRIGERFAWGAPNAFDESWAAARALRAACGDGDVVNVGNPESEGVFNARYAG